MALLALAGASPAEARADGATFAPPPEAAFVTPSAIDRMARAAFGNDAPWYRDRIPFFQSADPRLDAVYNYRWQLVRAHLRDLGPHGFITTEFADDVPWQRAPYASLNDATTFHISEERWLRDRQYLSDYIAFMAEGGDDRHFSDDLQAAIWGRYLIDGDRAEVLRHRAALGRLFAAWDDHFDAARGLYFIEPLLDATEYSVASIEASGGRDGFRGGDGFRPSINSYMAANARALAAMARLAGDRADANAYTTRAQALTARLEALWNPALGHYTDRYQAGTASVTPWQQTQYRELVGYLPWAYDLAPDDAAHAGAWAAVLDPAMLAGPHGLRTTEPRYPHYMQQYRYAGAQPECQWNGPVWPYQTTQVLAGMINLLDHGHATGPVTRGDFLRLLRQYAALHWHDGRLDLEEDYDPATGAPIVGLARSHHYFHSGFIDLVLTGVVGIRPRADDVLEINPLLPPAGDAQALAWFRAVNVPWHGHLVGVRWDADGRHFGAGAGLAVSVDGRAVARRATLTRIVLTVPRRPLAPAPAREINVAVQLNAGDWPHANASSNADPARLHAAIDGRLWFFADMPHGWQSTAGPQAQRFAVTLQAPARVHAAELAFRADEQVAAPDRVTIAGHDARGWHRLGRAAALANGITRIDWGPRRIDALRAVMSPHGGRPIGLVALRVLARAAP